MTSRSSVVPRSLLAGAVAGLALLAVFVWQYGTGVTTDDLGHAVVLKAIVTLGPVVLAGAPVVLLVRYGTVTPVAVGGLLVGAALLENNTSEGLPLFTLLVVGWPYCLALYLTLAGGEYTLRQQTVIG